MEVKIKSFTHDDLVNILSTATYGNPALDIHFVEKEKYEHLFSDGDCWEDKLALILANGGMIEIEDLYTTGDRGIYGTFHVKTKYNEENNSVSYFVTLQTLLDGINSNQESIRYANELLVTEEGDMYTAWNLLQIAVFGDIIYG